MTIIVDGVEAWDEHGWAGREVARRRRGPAGGRADAALRRRRRATPTAAGATRPCSRRWPTSAARTTSPSASGATSSPRAGSASATLRSSRRPADDKAHGLTPRTAALVAGPPRPRRRRRPRSACSSSARAARPLTPIDAGVRQGLPRRTAARRRSPPGSGDYVKDARDCTIEYGGDATRCTPCTPRASASARRRRRTAPARCSPARSARRRRGATSSAPSRVVWHPRAAICESQP